MKTLLVLVAFASIASAQSEVWIGSNVGTKDLPALVNDVDRWPNVRAVTKVFTFYSQQITSDESSQCPSCEDNIFPKLQQKGVFQKLADMGLRINIETGSVKPQHCDAKGGIDTTIYFLDRFKSMGIPVDHVSMDEPLMSGEVWCKQPAAYTAEKVAEYMKAVHQHWEKVFPDTPVSIGLLEPYPRHEMAAIISFIKMLVARGQKPDYFHLDVNKHEMAGRKYNDSKIKSDFRKLAQYLSNENIPWGTFFASWTGETPAKFRAEFLDSVRKIKRWYGPTEHLVFQSWEGTTENGMDVNRRPDNLPESSAYSMTGMIRQSLPILGGRK